MRIAYFDCFGGAAGDMLVGAMIDAGLDKAFLLDQLGSCGIAEVDFEISAVKRSGIAGVSFRPIAKDCADHRNLADVTEIILHSGISKTAKDNAVAIFNLIAQAEAKIHGVGIDEVHFHEVGAIDSIIDVVGACVGLEALEIEKVYCSELATGSGTVECAHGTMIVPAPATMEIVKISGASVTSGAGKTEMLTPTGAAILGYFTSDFGPLPAMTVESIGYGAGTRNPAEYPNVIRLMIGQSQSATGTDTVCVIETNIDDMTGETISYVCGKLFEAGALDVYTTSIQMKNNRPAVKLTVICEPDMCKSLEYVMFTQGITLGVRRQLMQRSKLQREIVAVETRFGVIDVKLGSYDGRLVSVKPEHVQCAKAADIHNTPIKRVVDEVLTVLKENSQ